MEWRDQLREIVEHANRVPTFEEWIMSDGYRDLPDLLGGPLQLHSVMLALYIRYQRTFGIL